VFAVYRKRAMQSPSILVLTGPAGALSEPTLERVFARVPDIKRLDRLWLAPGQAWQAEYEAPPEMSPQAIRERVGAALDGLPIDANIVGLTGDRRKRLLIADMESTIIEQEMLDELAGYVGLREKIAGITERAMRGEIEFEAALRERVGLLAGLDARVLDEVAGRMTLMPGAEVLVRTMKASCAYCALVSGGFTVFTERIARRLGFDEHQANTLEIARGKLTGRVVEPILGREAKLAALERLTAQRGLSLQDTVAVGDGANDLAMIEAAGLGVAFRAKPKVREAALAAPGGAVISHGDLAALLYLQDYSKIIVPMGSIPA